MSWYISVAGKAGKLSNVIKEKFEGMQGCPSGSDEEKAKNSLGAVAEILCSSLPSDKVVNIVASGSAWNTNDGKAQSQTCEFKLTTTGDFIE